MPRIVKCVTLALAAAALAGCGDNKGVQAPETFAPKPTEPPVGTGGGVTKPMTSSKNYAGPKTNAAE